MGKFQGKGILGVPCISCCSLEAKHESESGEHLAAWCHVTILKGTWTFYLVCAAGN